MNPVLYDFGAISIRWYSIFILLGMLFGGVTVLKEAKRWQIDEDFVINFLIPPTGCVTKEPSPCHTNWYNSNNLNLRY